MVLSCDRYVIGFLLGMAAVGIYAAAYGIGSLIYAYMGVLTLPLQATLSHLYDEGRMEEVKNHLSYSVKYLLALTIPFVFGAVVLEQPLLTFLTTSEIATQGRFVLPLAALATLVLGIHNIIYHVLLLTRKTAIIGITWMGAAVLNVGLNIVAVPRIGIVGAAITTLVVFILVTAITNYYSFKEIKFKTDWYFIIKSVAASVIMSGVVWWLHPQGDRSVIGAVLLGVVVYGLAIFLMRGFSQTEISLFRGLMRRSIRIATLENERRD